MNRNSLLACSFLVVVLLFSACEKKGDKNAITPDYSATGNPNPNNQTVTGASSYSNPATQNTSILVGTSGWGYFTCATTNSTTLKGFISDGPEVTLSFAGPATTQTYAIASVASSNACAMTILNPPNQPAGIMWYGKVGSVVVSTSSTGVTATFVNVVCTQQSFGFPTVNASGTLSCH
jgi:hypothetical protein